MPFIIPESVEAFGIKIGPKFGKPMMTISQAVGDGAPNSTMDVMLVQYLLNNARHLPNSFGRFKLALDGKFGPATAYGLLKLCNKYSIRNPGKPTDIFRMEPFSMATTPSNELIALLNAEFYNASDFKPGTDATGKALLPPDMPPALQAALRQGTAAFFPARAAAGRV